MISTKFLRSIPELAPPERAAAYFELGKELQRSQTKISTPGYLPSALNMEELKDTHVLKLLKRLHGFEFGPLKPQTGVISTGRRLEISGGKFEDLVLTVQARKKYAILANKNLQRLPNRDVALRHCGLGLLESDPIARCMAAHAYFRATGARNVVLPVLMNALQSPNEEEKLVAAHCLSEVSPAHTRPLQGTDEDDQYLSGGRKKRKSMTIIVHGTYAKNFRWYKPGGDFHSYIKNSVYPDVYSGSDFYYWSGRYSLSDNGLKRIWTKAAKKLVEWCLAHPAETIRIIAHSHGNNVVNIATQLGLPACVLIQLAPPVHLFSLPEMGMVSSQRLFNIHSTIDLVVALDGAAQDYSGTPIETDERKRIIAWFGHIKPHVPHYWRKKQIPEFVTTVCP